LVRTTGGREKREVRKVWIGRDSEKKQKKVVGMLLFEI